VNAGTRAGFGLSVMAVGLLALIAVEAWATAVGAVVALLAVTVAVVRGGAR
jgi:uncharacterized membrane protein